MLEYPCSMTSQLPFGISSRGMYGVGAVVGDGCGVAAAATATPAFGDCNIMQMAIATTDAPMIATLDRGFVFKSIPSRLDGLSRVLRPVGAPTSPRLRRNRRSTRYSARRDRDRSRHAECKPEIK